MKLLKNTNIIPWNKGNRIKGVCPVCKKAHNITNDWGGRRKTCSKNCAYKYLSLIHKNKGTIPPSQKGKKWGVDYPMEKHNWWKGGITPKILLIREGNDYKRWRTAVFERDNYTCQICGKHGGKLNAHHIKSFSLFPKLRFDVSNGITLCEKCHIKTDSFGWKARWSQVV